MAEEEWTELLDTWRRDLGAFDDMAGYSRLQASRPGLAVLLLCKGSPTAFVKLQPCERGTLSRERIALEAVWNYRPRSFVAPEPLLSGSVSGWQYLAMSPIRGGLHRPPCSPPLAAILEEIDAALAGLPRSTDVPNHWRPMHGDFTPWNLREFRGGSLTLLDWENAAWAPPGADQVFYLATAAALWNRGPDRCEAAEAVRFWRGRVLEQNGTARDQRLARALGAALSRMAGS